MAEPCCMAAAHDQACSCRQPFIGASRAQTMLRDFDRLRRAIRQEHDIEAAERALDMCERWIGCINPARLAAPEE